jgi:hypothetical protein
MSLVRVFHFLGLTNLSEAEVQRYEALTRDVREPWVAPPQGPARIPVNFRSVIAAAAGGNVIE